MVCSKINRVWLRKCTLAKAITETGQVPPFSERIKELCSDLVPNSAAKAFIFTAQKLTNVCRNEEKRFELSNVPFFALLGLTSAICVKVAHLKFVRLLKGFLIVVEKHKGTKFQIGT